MGVAWIFIVVNVVVVVSVFSIFSVFIVVADKIAFIRSRVISKTGKRGLLQSKCKITKKFGYGKAFFYFFGKLEENC